MPAFAADLHNHTPCVAADYRGDLSTTPRQIACAALDAGLNIYAATDHFTAEAAAPIARAASELAEETGRALLVLGGAELKVRWKGDEAHVVAVFEAGLAQDRFERLIAALGLTHPVAARAELPSAVIRHDPVDVCREIDRLGGLALIGHVDRVFGKYRLVDRPCARWLSVEPSVAAIEVCEDDSHGLFDDPSCRALVGCSDSHSLAEIGRRRTVVAMEELSFEALRAALLRGASVPVLGTAAA